MRMSKLQVAPPATRCLQLLACALLLASSAAGKGGSGDRNNPFEEAAQVTLIEVPVTVTDRSGQPIRGLGADDFLLLDNGDPQTIESVDIVDLASMQATDPVAEKRMVEELPSSARRHLLLFFDFSYSSPGAIARARRAARDFVLEQLHPADLVGLAVFTLERGPQLLVTFTPDRAQVARALDALEHPQLLGLARSDPLRFVLESPQDTLGGLASAGQLDNGSPDASGGVIGNLATNLSVLAKQIDKSNKAYEHSRLSAWSGAMGELARILGAVRGRKHVLYFSEGFDGRLLLGREADPDDPRVQEDNLNLQRGFHWLVNSDDIYGNAGLKGDIARMLEELRRADCVLQAMHIGGLAADLPAARRASRVGRDALFYLADATGGDLYENANNFGPQLSKALTRSSLTYVLTFRPNQVMKVGDYRRLKVKLRSGRARISHRSGYYAPRPFAELHPMEKDLLAADAIASATPRSEIGIDLLAAPFRTGEGNAYVPVVIEASGLDLLRDYEGSELGVEIYAYATDSEQQMQGLFTDQVRVDLDLGRQNLLNTGIKYYGHLRLPPGSFLLRVLVRNPVSGRSGVMTQRLQVPDFQQGEPVVLPPFFLEQEASWILVRNRGEETQRRTVVYPFTLGGEPYVPAAQPTLEARQSVELCLVSYHLDADSNSLQARVLDADGNPVGKGRVEVTERTITGIPGLDRYRLRFQTRGLDPGEYQLEVRTTDPGTGKAVDASARFRVIGS